MVIVSPLMGLWDPLQMAVSWLINGGDPNHLLSGVILQVLVPPRQTNIAGGKIHLILMVFVREDGDFRWRFVSLPGGTIPKHTQTTINYLLNPLMNYYSDPHIRIYSIKSVPVVSHIRTVFLTFPSVANGCLCCFAAEENIQESIGYITVQLHSCSQW